MLTPPQRDEQGRVIPHNHPQILDNDWVIRLVFIGKNEPPVDLKFPEGKRLSLTVWEPSSGVNEGLSVNLQSLIFTGGLESPEKYSKPASIMMNVGDIRRLGFEVGYDPVKDDPKIPDNPYHCQIWGASTRGERNQLKNISQWLVPLAGVSIGRDVDLIQVRG